MLWKAPQVDDVDLAQNYNVGDKGQHE
jgi:hypothetical protein